ncbi:Dps family protein [[Mycoplasma] imitans]|uniref:Dps family protein n=1 Tax=[Mycoplasma] imitans TaxID=29560 RepID=UPI0004876D0C|nr:DNA starvation/stationary phase protection protein [[Mycoplasma] imitans]
MQKNVKDLLTLQASLLVFGNKVRNFHWNMKGHDFFPMHEELGKLYEEGADKVDLVAEKIVMLDGAALGSFKEALEHSMLKEVSGKPVTSKDAFKVLKEDIKTLLNFVGNMQEISYRVQPTLDEVVLFLDLYLWKITKSLE